MRATEQAVKDGQIRMQISHEDLFNANVDMIGDDEDTQSEKEPVNYTTAQIDQSGIITLKQHHNAKSQSPFPVHAQLTNGKFGSQISGNKREHNLSGDLIQVISQRDSEETLPNSVSAKQREQITQHREQMAKKENQGSSMTFYDESEQGTNPMQTKMVSNNQVKMATADDDLMSTTKVYGSSKVPNLSPKKLNP